MAPPSWGTGADYIVNAYNGPFCLACVEKDEAEITPNMERLLSLFDVDPRQVHPLDFGRRGWKCYGMRRVDGSDPSVSVVLAASGPRGITDIKKEITADNCVVLLAARNTLFLRALGKSLSVQLDGEGEHERVCRILESCDISGKMMRYLRGLRRAIRDIPVSSAHFDNRGIFSNHYLKNRLWDDLRRDIGPEVEAVAAALKRPPEEMLVALGWDLDGDKRMGRTCRFKGVSVVVAPKGRDLSVRTRDDVAPSYTAVAELKHSPWVILTNGREWRLYTSRVSASTTNYLGIDTDGRDPEPLRYLAALFGAATHEGGADGISQIDEFFDQAQQKARSLEDDLRSKVLGTGGLFLDIVKGILDHDMKRTFRPTDLAAAKETALAVMYRVWFVLYAESRNLLPVRDPKYSSISLRSMHAELDGYEGDPDGYGCWDALLDLFTRIRDGSPDHNLPQYDGDLFRTRPSVDSIKVRNKFIASAMRELLETDGQAVDYGDLGVRHLGSIYESVLEFEVRQANRDIMLVEDGKGVREVESKAESTYSHKKNDLYLASGAGLVSRKTTASFYTPDEIVSFLVRRGLDPLLAERRKQVAADVRRYKKDPSEKNRLACMDRILDLQVLDPAMGSGHFLVEALNQITLWATDVLNSHPDHPLVAEIDGDRRTVVGAQAKRGVTIDESLLTADVLLKRRIMKRCIFGVDLNPLAVELARLSLWLDSFAIGVPLTYLNHHIQHGDSTIGGWLAGIRGPRERSMDEWLSDPADHGTVLDRVSHSPDITVEQALASRRGHEEYERQTAAHRAALDVLAASQMDPTVIPPKTKRKEEYIRRLAEATGASKDDLAAKKRIDALAEKYSFFHWEIEMMDAFTDERRGFDLVIGNPPWEKPKPSEDEFFTLYDSTFRSLTPNTKKAKRKKEILANIEIKKAYDKYLEGFRDRGIFYKTYELQGTGHRDMWQLVLERMLFLVTRSGVVSVVVPSQILGNIGSVDMRTRLLGMDIVQAYVFENRKKIFPIDSRYRFVLLTIKNRQDGPEEFPAAFYLHDLFSLKDNLNEQKKFTICSKRRIAKISPNDMAIPEVFSETSALLERLSECKTLGERSNDGWRLILSQGFNTTYDAHLFKNDRKGWPVLKGINIHQFNHAFAIPDFTCNPLDGLERLERKKAYTGHCKNYHESYMLVFRSITSPTNMRTVIASIVPPHTFHAHSLNSVILTKNYKAVFDDEYNHKLAYLAAVMNSLTFDFIARSKTQMNLAPIIPSLPLPNTSDFDLKISIMSARLVCSFTKKQDYDTFANSFNLQPTTLSPSDRIDITAKLDAMVGHAYDLSMSDYQMILDSFDFDDDPSLLEVKTADWSDNKVLKRFYGEVRKAAMPHFEAIAKERGGE